MLKEKTKKLEKRGESKECKLQEAGGLDPLSPAPCPCMQFVQAEFLATFDILRKESCHKKKTLSLAKLTCAWSNRQRLEKQISFLCMIDANKTTMYFEIALLMKWLFIAW